MDPRSHPLFYLDRQPHTRNYGRYITVFSFPYPHRADAAYRALRTGLAATLKKFPFLADLLDLDKDGELPLLYDDGGEKDWMVEVGRVMNVRFVTLGKQMGYGELERQNFDPSIFSLAHYPPWPRKQLSSAAEWYGACGCITASPTAQA